MRSAMVKEILMPKMGMTMETGTIQEWFVKEGDAVIKGDVLFSVETDKAVLDVEAFVDGTILKILLQEHESAPVLSCVGYIGDPGEAIPDREPSVEDTAKAEVSVKKPEEKADEPQAKADGKVKATPRAKAICKERNIDISKVMPNAEGIVGKNEVLSYLMKEATQKITPTAAKMAKHYGVKAEEIPHDGSRIYKKDVEAYITGGQSDAEPEYVEISHVQKIAGEMINRSWQTMPMVTNCIELDVSRTLELVDFLNDHYRASLGLKFGLTDILIKVLAQAMAQNPNANVYYDEGRLRRVGGIHIGLAAATPRGLVVPVIRNADKLNVMEVCREKNRLVAAAREGTLSPADMGGASTTLTNMGAYRAEMFTPIINYPESCIFGTGTVKKKPVVINDEIVIRPMMWLNFTYDHRILDGEKAAKLLNAVKDCIEMPGLFIGYEGGAK